MSYCALPSSLKARIGAPWHGTVFVVWLLINLPCNVNFDDFFLIYRESARLNLSAYGARAGIDRFCVHPLERRGERGKKAHRSRVRVCIALPHTQLPWRKGGGGGNEHLGVPAMDPSGRGRELTRLSSYVLVAEPPPPLSAGVGRRRACA